jgi:integrase
LKAALSKAVEWRMIQEHPLRTVKLLREDRKPRERYLTDEEEGRLMSALDRREERFFQKRDAVIDWCQREDIQSPADPRAAGFYDYLQPLIILALETGMRWGELTTLEWGDVDLSRNRIGLRGTLTKSSQSRTIPLTERAVDLLQPWQRQTGGAGLVFESPRGGRLKSIRDSWTRVLVDAQIEDFHFHDLRHTYASRLVAAGADLYVIKELLGHSTISVTERYSHVAESLMVSTVARLDVRRRNTV